MEPLEVYDSLQESKSITDLPNELIFPIVKFLNIEDFFAFSSTCKRFSDVCKAITDINFEASFGNGLFIEGRVVPRFYNFLTNQVNPLLVKSVNVSGLYWINSTILQEFLVRCKNLVKMEVAETHLTINQIVTNILPHCKSVMSLSFTMRKENWFCSDPELLLALENLLKVEIVMEQGAIFSKLVHFLSKCVKLEDLVVSSAADYSITHQLGLHQGPINPTLIGPFPKLKSFIFVFPPALARRPQSFFNLMPVEQRQLTTFWSNVTDYSNYSHFELDGLSALSWNVPPVQLLHAENIRDQVLPSNLRGVWEPFPVLMQSPESSTLLKLANCVYDGTTFREFCLHHQLIEVLKLRKGKRRNLDGTEKATSLVWNDNSWKMLLKLSALSLEASLIAISEGLEASGKRKYGSCKESYKEDEDQSYIPFMRSVIQNCPLIQELEIIGCGTKIIKRMELSAIAECKMLKRLTLTDFMVADGPYFKEILTECKLLENLRLKNIGQSKTCCYEVSLVNSLPSAKNLKTFCIIQGFMTKGHVLKLLYALEQCSSLSRVSLVIPNVPLNMSTREFSNTVVRFCDKLKQLVAFFAVLNVPSDCCIEVKRHLSIKFEKERPAFCVDIQHQTAKHKRTSSYSTDLPLMHRDVLTQIGSRVAMFPLGREPIAHRFN